MSALPDKKKRKSNDGAPVVASAKKTWREKSIERFDLQPVPDGWKDSVAIGSDEAWQRYFSYRTKQEKADFRNEKLSASYDSDGEEAEEDEGNWEREAMWDIQLGWTDEDWDGMGRLKKLMKDGCEWQWTPKRPKIDWEDPDKPRSADYFAHVWSPYAIPHAFQLSHSWYGKVRWEGYDLTVDWNLKILDFEDTDGTRNSVADWVKLCSTEYDNIKTGNLTHATCQRLRKFLYGSNSDESKEVTCSDRDFMFLLFGSMGSYDKDLMEDAKDCSLGYSWCPWKDEKMLQQLKDDKAPENDEWDGNPPEEGERYNPRWCSWLRYGILKATNSLGPISKHYKGSSAKKESSRDL